MEITTKMKDELVQWMGAQEKALLECDLTLGTEEFPIHIESLGYLRYSKAIHLFDIRPVLMILDIPEETAKIRVYDATDGNQYIYRYSIMIGSIEYFSLHKYKWGEEL